MVNLLAKTASQITLSKRIKPNETAEEREEYQKLFSNIVTVQDEVKRLTRYGAEFTDGSQGNFTVVLFATGNSIEHCFVNFAVTNWSAIFFPFFQGYNYSYPFLSVDTGIHVDDKFIEPLFKQIFNIDHPTMAFIGVPTAASNFLLFDLQVNTSDTFVLKSERDLVNEWSSRCQVFIYVRFIIDGIFRRVITKRHRK